MNEPMNPSTAHEPTLRTDSALFGDEPLPATRAPKSPWARFLPAALALIVLLAGVAWFLARREPPASSQQMEQVAAMQSALAPVAPPEAEIRHPIPGEPAPSLPELAGSDRAFAEALAGVLPGGALSRWLIPQNLIRNIVATVDNVPRQTLARRLVPVVPVPGTFTVAERASGFVIDAANAQRYVPLVRVLEAIDPEKLVAVYVRWYPRFQDAYRELGYPSGYFNDRLVEAIDSLLAAPASPATIEVTQPKVLWQFADAGFEALPAGQKIMLRMGSDNAARVKARLALIRRLVTRVPPNSGSASRQAIVE
jgi:hypothetical protein